MLLLAQGLEASPLTIGSILVACGVALASTVKMLWSLHIKQYTKLESKTEAKDVVIEELRRECTTNSVQLADVKARIEAHLEARQDAKAIFGMSADTLEFMAYVHKQKNKNSTKETDT